MSHQPVALKENDNIKKAATLFLKHSFDGAPVVNNIGEIVGIFTKTHLYRAIVSNLPGDTPVSKLMKRNVITIDDNCSTEKAWQMAWTYGVGRLPVVDKNGQLLAMMTRTDLVQAFEQKHKDTIKKLNAILNSAHNGICAVDKYGTIITFNLAAERITGIKARDVVNNPLVEFFPNNELITVLTTGQPLYNQRMKLGNRIVIVNITPITSRQHSIGAVAVFQD
ncbi:MAG TPA: CBS domain-containing protein, partial [Clostridia bacterium]|nr:CBS domain-containing protein [Clostridia bacterium]